MVRYKYAEKNNFENIGIDLNYFDKGIEKHIRNFKMDDLEYRKKTITLPKSFVKIVRNNKNYSVFLGKIANMYYEKIKSLDFKFHFFTQFLLSAFIDFLINNKKITDFKREKNEDNKNVIKIDGKKYKVLRVLN